MTGTDSTHWRSDDARPPDGRAWDLLVVGGGTAGIVAARTAAGFGASVLLVERARTGGDCLWTGCVPSKALLAAAHAASAARAAGRYGVHVDGVRPDFAAVMAHVHDRIAAIEPDDAPDTLRATGARVAQATARFTGPEAVSLGGAAEPGADSAVDVTFRRAVLATGSDPAVPPVPGLAAAAPLTSDSVWALTRLPERLLVLGGGAIGCELGQALARLGAHVTVVEGESRLLPQEDPRAGEVLREALQRDGVRVHVGVALASVQPGGSGAGVGVLADGTRVGFDRVLVAVGRTPRTRDLGLDLAGVALDARGHVVVDATLRTTNPRVLAAGDLTGHPALTHVAGVHGALAASNAVLGLRRTVDPVVPRVTFTQPEVASVGVGAHDVAGRHGFTVRTVEHAHVDRAVAERETGGLTRLVLDRRGRLVGATVVGPRAGESLPELVLAIRHGLRARDLAAATHAYPTYGDGPWKAAIEQVQAGLRRQPLRAVTTALTRLRRRGRPRAGSPDAARPPRRRRR